MSEDISVYIHIPYCRSKCGYCDFCSSPDLSTADAYAAELKRRIAVNATSKPVESVYFGGGTPTYIGADRLSGILKTVKENYVLAPDCEITCEANPGTADADALSKLRNAGINRISAGIQTAVPEELTALQRTSHTVTDGEMLVKNARAAGFDNISLDLMYGIPGQSVESLMRSLDFVLGLGPEHISAYALKLEEGTPLYKAAPVLPDDDTVAEMYVLINGELKKNGYVRYEISNFSKPGHESRHNLRYWKGGDYMGFGISAASFLNSVRYLQAPDMKKFLSGEGPDVEEIVDGEAAKAEYIMLRLRLTEGIDKDGFKERFKTDLDEKYGSKIKKYTEGGFAVDTDKRFYLTDKGIFVSNTVIADLIPD